MKMFRNVMLLIACLSAVWVHAADLKLAANGRTPYHIVIPDDAIPAEKTGAEELQSHLKKLCGAEFPVITASQYTSGPMIAVGFNAKLPESLQQSRYSGLGEEELVIDAKNDILLLGGGRPRGALYAVYQFLERLGVRWYTPTETFFPARKDELLADVTPERYKSPFIYRTQVAGNGETPEWSARNRLNSFKEWKNPGEKYGGGVFQGPGMETFFIYLSRGDMDQHPEWLAEVNGKREAAASGASWGVCLSNKALRAEMVKRALNWARKNPTATAVWLAQNDGSVYCTCSECKKFYAAHGNQPSSLIVQLLNELAAEVAKEFPKMQVKTLAYAWSTTPPENMKLADNVSVMFCATLAPWEAQVTIARDPQGEPLVKNLQAWKKVAKNFEVYLYGYPHNDYWAPSPCLYSQARNIRWAYESGITQIHHQLFGWAGQPGGDMVYLRVWLYTRLAWNPLLDPVALVKEFCYNCYGSVGGKAVFDAITEYHRKVESGDISVHKLYLPFLPDYVDIKLAKKLSRKLQDVYSKLEEPYKKRVGYAMLPMLWADYWSNIKTLCQYNPERKTFGIEIADRERVAATGRLIRQIMIENNVIRLSQSEEVNPSQLYLEQLTKEYPAYELSNSQVSVITVPDCFAKMTDFILKADGFNPIKPAYVGTLRLYPRYYSYWMDYYNDSEESAMKVTHSTPTSLTMTGRRSNETTYKTMSLKGDILTQTLKIVPKKTRECSVKVAPLLDLSSKGFGTYPTLRVGLKSGGWRESVLGKLTSFWYQEENIPVKDFNGKLQLVSEDGKHTLELSVNPANVDSMSYMYDRYANPHPQLEIANRVLQLVIRGKKVKTNAGEPYEFSIDMKVTKN